MNYLGYKLSEDDYDFLLKIKDMVLESQSFVDLKYKDELFMLEYVSEKIEVWSKGDLKGMFNSFDEFLLNFKLDGKSFIEMVSEIDFD